MSAARLVTLEDLARVQQHLLPHLTACRACAVEDHRYCAASASTGATLQAFLDNFTNGAQLHAAFVRAVIAARIKAGG